MNYARFVHLFCSFWTARLCVTYQVCKLIKRKVDLKAFYCTSFDCEWQTESDRLKACAECGESFSFCSTSVLPSVVTRQSQWEVKPGFKPSLCSDHLKSVFYGLRIERFNHFDGCFMWHSKLFGAASNLAFKTFPFSFLYHHQPAFPNRVSSWDLFAGIESVVEDHQLLEWFAFKVRDCSVFFWITNW